MRRRHRRRYAVRPVRRWMPAIAGTMMAASTLLGVTAPVCADHDDLRAQIADLEARVAAMERDPWLREQRQLELRSLIADVLADAHARQSLLNDGATAGWDDGFFIATADRNFMLRLGAMLQFREVFNRRHGPQRSAFGFERARTRLILSGHVIDPSITYRIMGQFARSEGAFSLEDAYLRWAFAEHWAVTAGQFRIPLLREILVSRSRQQVIERALVHSTFTGGRSAGVMIEYNADTWRASGSFTDGYAVSGGFNSPWQAPNVRYAVTGRVEQLIMGTWRQFEDFTSWQGEPTAIMVGSAVHYQKGESGAAFDGDILSWTIDASLEFGGANVFAYVVSRRLNPRGDESLNQLGAVVQGGWLILPKWEVFARYEWGDSNIQGEPNLSVMTAGVTHFISRHRLKWMLDVGYGLNAVGPTWSFNPAGWRTDVEGRSGQIVVRTQMQMSF